MKAVSFGAPPSPQSTKVKTALTPASARKQLAANENGLAKAARRSSKQLNDAPSKPVHETATSSRHQGEGSRGSVTDDEMENEDIGNQAVPMDLVRSSSASSMGRQLAVEALTSKEAPTYKMSKKAKQRKRKATLHIEVALLPQAYGRSSRHDTVKTAVYEFITQNFDSLLPESVIFDWDEVAILKQAVDMIRVAECSSPSEIVYIEDVTLKIHVYCPSRAFIVDSFSAAAPTDTDEADGTAEDSDVMAATVAQLPSLALEGIWDNLIYEDDVKQRLLNYIYSTQLFGDRLVDFNVITWNRVVLLHGPPGTGKTSLCKALAQKLAIRLSDRYTKGKLVEINSHSIMSKWFSESGKLVQRLFTNVLELVEDETCFVVVLIDEVESLTAARAGAMSGKEPSDAVRVVNALLTQLDKLKNKKNVLVMTTSNLSSAIDSAFIDRADIKQYIGLPPVQAVYWILLGCLRELMRSQIIGNAELYEWKQLKEYTAFPSMPGISRRALRNSNKLRVLAEKCHGMSGRTLRRIPLLAHARYIAGSFAASSYSDGAESATESENDESDEEDEEEDAQHDVERIEVWLDAMLETAKAERIQMDRVDSQQS